MAADTPSQRTQIAKDFMNEHKGATPPVKDILKGISKACDTFPNKRAYVQKIGSKLIDKLYIPRDQAKTPAPTHHSVATNPVTKCYFFPENSGHN